MKDILLRHGGSFIECELEGLKITYTFSDDPKAHHVAELKNRGLYEDIKRELNKIYAFAKDKDFGYAIACETLETVDFRKVYFVDNSSYVNFDPRTDEEVQEYLEEAEDKVWLMRNCLISRKIPKHEAGRPAMNRIFSKYDDIPKEGYNDWECGYWNGIMGALRWIVGCDKNFLDS